MVRRKRIVNLMENLLCAMKAAIDLSDEQETSPKGTSGESGVALLTVGPRTSKCPAWRYAHRLVNAGRQGRIYFLERPFGGPEPEGHLSDLRDHVTPTTTRKSS